MSNADIRKAHKLLDYVSQGRAVLDDEIKLLRSFLPELPEQKTLKEIHEEVDEAWLATNDPELKERLREISTQIRGLFYSSPNSPALPAGMRIADHESYGRVVASPGLIPDGRYQIFVLDSGTKTGAECEFVHPYTLEFIDAEPAKPAHPEFLETEADYQNAPEGTIAACEDSPPWHKFDSAWLSTAAYDGNSAKGMTGIIRRVLRWGDGE